MPRAIPADTRRAVEDEQSPAAILAFLTIRHSGLAEPIRVVSDVLDYEYDGHLWTGIVFDLRVLTDEDSPPQAQLRVQNVDRRIGQALRGSSERARLDIRLLSSADFDLSVEPRQPIGTPGVIYEFSDYDLTGVKANAIDVTGAVSLRDFAREPWPYRRATQDVLPGLYR